MSQIDQDVAAGQTSRPIDRLRRLDACAVSDALDKLGLQGAVSGLARQSSNRCIAGRVITVQLTVMAVAPPQRMKDTFSCKDTGRGRTFFWWLDPDPNVTRRTDSHPGLLPLRAHVKEAVGDLLPSGRFSADTCALRYTV